ncbi:MAG TPA: suppressor of fused domain protein [Acidobacteriota bacterium]
MDEIKQGSGNDRTVEPAHGDPELIEKIGKHIEKYVGPIETVFHEIDSDRVHVDVYYVKPYKKRKYHTLITCGMSEKPMKVPSGLENFKYAELVMTLPPEWQVSMDAFQDEKYYWPVRQLKSLARFPHSNDTWLCLDHTVANGNDSPEPYAYSTDFCCTLIGLPISLARDFFDLQISKSKRVHFFSVIPLYIEEMNFKMLEGADKLYDLFDQNQIDDVVKVDRPNVCLKL